MKLNEIKKTGAWSEMSATLNNNFQRVENAIEALNYATRKNKGYFKSVDELRNVVPSANKGEIAYVGTTSPYAIYEWNGQWVDTGEVHTDNVELGNYYTKEEIDEVIGDWNDEPIADVIGDRYGEDEDFNVWGQMRNTRGRLNTAEEEIKKVENKIPIFQESTEEAIEDMIANGTWKEGVIYYTVEE